MTLQLEDGTVVTQTAFLATYAPATTPDDVYTLTDNIYEEFSLPGALPTHTSRRLKFRAGQVITQDMVDDAYLEPTLDATTPISPATGVAAGSTAVTITGTNLFETTGVTIGGNAATSLVVVSDTQVTCVTAAHAAGAVNVVLTTPAGSVTGTGIFTYT